MATSYDRLRPRPDTATRVQQLVERYPDLSDGDLAELIELYPQLNLLDQGLMTADDRLAAKLADFHRDHGAKLKPPAVELFAFLAFPAVLALFALWWVLT